GCLRAPGHGRDARQPDAVHAPRRGRGGVAVDRPDHRRMGGRQPGRARLYGRHMGAFRRDRADRARRTGLARKRLSMGRVAWHEFSSGTGLAAALAGAVAGRLAQAIAERGSALLALSGGSTPKRFLAQLSHEPLDWSRVTVTLVDERFAAPTSPRSNARLLAD